MIKGIPILSEGDRIAKACGKRSTAIRSGFPFLSEGEQIAKETRDQTVAGGFGHAAGSDGQEAEKRRAGGRANGGKAVNDGDEADGGSLRFSVKMNGAHSAPKQREEERKAV